jgi:hypothetical protein
MQKKIDLDLKMQETVINCIFTIVGSFLAAHLRSGEINALVSKKTWKAPAARRSVSAQFHFDRSKTFWTAAVNNP